MFAINLKHPALCPLQLVFYRIYFSLTEISLVFLLHMYPKDTTSTPGTHWFKGSLLLFMIIIGMMMIDDAAPPKVWPFQHHGQLHTIPTLKADQSLKTAPPPAPSVEKYFTR